MLTEMLNHSPEKVPFATLQVLNGVVISACNYCTSSFCLGSNPACTVSKICDNHQVAGSKQ